MILVRRVTLRCRRVAVSAAWFATLFAALCATLLLSPSAPAATAAPPQAHPAYQPPAYQPMSTGSPTEKMDAPETNSEMEAYRHSSTVQALARLLHVSPERAAQIFEDLNSGLLILAILYFAFKLLPPAFKARRAKIGRELAEAGTATAEAYQRLQVVEARLASLDTEIASIRSQAEHDSAADEKRIGASLEAERARIVRAAEQEIGAAQAAAQRELKRFAADLAVERAMSRIELSAEADRVLVNEFTEGLAGMLPASDFGKRGQN